MPTIRLLLVPALALPLAACGPSARETGADGAALFAGSGCGLCHGAQGRGDGPLAASGRVQPVDLTDVSAYRYGRTPAAVAAVISAGRSSERGAMPPHGHLTERETRTLAAWVLQLSPPGAPGAEEKH
jgi:high-affinity iron transporter